MGKKLECVLVTHLFIFFCSCSYTNGGVKPYGGSESDEYVGGSDYDGGDVVGVDEDDPRGGSEGYRRAGSDYASKYSQHGGGNSTLGRSRH